MFPAHPEDYTQDILNSVRYESVLASYEKLAMGA